MSLSGRKGALEGTKGGTQLTVAFLPSRQHRTPSAFVHCIRDGRIVRFGIGVQCEREREGDLVRVDRYDDLPFGRGGPVCCMLPVTPIIDVDTTAPPLEVPAIFHCL